MSAPYHIFPIAVISLVLYLLTYLTSKVKIISLSVHRQIWNILLLITFLVTAILGLFLAVKVNYKLNLQITDQLIIWHVNFGIGMSMIAIFHFLWHLNYYIRFLKPGTRNNKQIILTAKEIYPASDQNIKIALKVQLPVFAMGINSLITQVILLREFMSIFQGNELVIGTILANWMILTGAGAYIGRMSRKINSSDGTIFIMLFLSCIIPLIIVILLNYLKNVVLPVGIMAGFLQVFLGSFLLLLPFCLLSGFLFPFYSNYLSKLYRVNLISNVYSIEAIGSLTGGFFYSFLLIYFFPSLQTLGIVFLINIIFALIFARKWEKISYKIIISLTASFIIASIFLFKLDYKIKGFLFPNQQLLFMKDTPYGNLVVTESAGQKNFYENNVLLFSTDNVIGSEERVHYAMLQHPRPDNILVIGGGISGMINEILKYPVKKIDHIEINPWVIKLNKKFISSEDDPHLNIINKDARIYLQNTDQKYDVIIIDLPPPASAQVNRFYTLEFFRNVRERSEEGSVLLLSLPSTENYVSEKAAKVQSVIYKTLKETFKNVTILPGEQNYFIASDRIPDIRIAHLVTDRKVENVYVNPYYIDDTGLQQRSEVIMQKIISSDLINKDFNPIAYFMEIGYWMSLFRFNYWIIGAIGIILLLIFLTRMNVVNIGLFTTGLTSSSAEIMLIIAFQVIYGYVYHVTSIIITIFMAGLAVGSLLPSRILRKNVMDAYWKVQSLIFIYCLLIPFFILFLSRYQINISFVYILFFISTLSISILTGFQFALASRIHQNSIAVVSSGIYSVDLLGSAIGAFLTSVVLYPVLGLVKMFILLALINLLAGLSSYLTGRKQYPG